MEFIEGIIRRDPALAEQLFGLLNEIELAKGESRSGPPKD